MAIYKKYKQFKTKFCLKEGRSILEINVSIKEKTEMPTSERTPEKLSCGIWLEVPVKRITHICNLSSKTIMGNSRMHYII